MGGVLDLGSCGGSSLVGTPSPSFFGRKVGFGLVLGVCLGFGGVLGLFLDLVCY